MYEAIVKYAIQGPECVKQGINSMCAKFHIVPKIIKDVPFSWTASTMEPAGYQM